MTGRTPPFNPEVRIDGRLKVTGGAAFLADRVPADTLWIAVVRSPYPHALIRSVSVDAARRMEGVAAVIAGSDVAGIRFGRRLQDWPLLAWDRVRFVGDRVAAVAATSPRLAAAAAAAIEVDYEELPAILSMDQATAEGAAVIHPDAAAYLYLGGSRPPAPHPNIQGRTVAAKGDPDIEAALARCPHVFEHRFETARQHQGHLEPHGASAWLVADGTIHVLTTNKSPFLLRDQLAASFGLPPERIVVDSGFIGGDFGGKGTSLDEGLCVVLSRETGRAVTSVMSYADELQAANPRHRAVVTLRTGVDRNGRILAHSADFRFEGGAYAAGKPMPDLTPPGSLGILSAYDIENLRVETTSYYTNTVPGGHMRGPGEVQASFAGESHIDIIASELGLDALEFRRLNAAATGCTDVVGRRMRQAHAAELLDMLAADRAERREQAAIAAADPGRAEPDGAEPGRWRRGRGIALTARHMEGGRMTVRLRATADGTVEVRTGIPDQGGGAHTMMARVAASVLSLPEERIRVSRETTAAATADLGVGASRVTYVGSRATAAAATALREEILRRAAERLPGVVGLEDGRFVRSDGSEAGSYAREIGGLAGDGIDAEGAYDSRADEGEPQDFSFAAYDVEVGVDERTGAIRLLDAFLAADVGTVINPVAHMGQIEGGFAFGLGAALLEELQFEDGRVTTVHLGDYKLPTIADVPRLRTRFLRSDGSGAFGAKMAGELTVGAVAPAIANAVAAAIGARVTSLPLSPERVLAALEAARTAPATVR